MKKHIVVPLLCALLLCAVSVFFGGCSARGASVSVADSVDVDLTNLGGTLLSAEIINIMRNSGEYLGKAIKVTGSYQNGFYAPTGRYYHYVITKDGDDCCREGFEFMWGDHLFPDDFPQMQEQIEVTGVFSKYEERGLTFYYLEVDDLTVL